MCIYIYIYCIYTYVYMYIIFVWCICVDTFRLLMSLLRKHFWECFEDIVFCTSIIHPPQREVWKLYDTILVLLFVNTFLLFHSPSQRDRGPDKSGKRAGRYFWKHSSWAKLWEEQTTRSLELHTLCAALGKIRKRIWNIKKQNRTELSGNWWKMMFLK